MFLLVSGASCAGKSTARRAVRDRLTDRVTCVEFVDVVAIPEVPDEAWRQRAVGDVVALALEHQHRGRHLMLCGDPVPPGEVFAAPRVTELAGGAVLLLDVSPEEQTRRLARRGDDLEQLHRHHAFQSLLRRTWPQEVAARPGWSYASLDTSTRTPADVADEVLAWARRAIHGSVPPAGIRSTTP